MLIPTWHILDCKRPCPSFDNLGFLASNTYFSHENGLVCCCCRHNWIFHWRCSIFLHPSDGSSIVPVFIIWCFILSFYRSARRAYQEFAATLQQLNHSAGMVDKRRLCYFSSSGSNPSWRNCSFKRHDTERHLGRNHLLLGIFDHRIFRLLALHRGTLEHQSHQSYHSYVFKRPCCSVLEYASCLTPTKTRRPHVLYFKHFWESGYSKIYLLCTSFYRTLRFYLIHMTGTGGHPFW